jgi:hypothetical protein
MFPAELTDARRDEMVDAVARAVVRRRLEAPATIAIEMHKPLTMVGSTLAMFLTPLAAPFVTWRRCDEVALFLMERDNLERLCRRIAELTARRDRTAAAGSPEPRTPNSEPGPSPESPS